MLIGLCLLLLAACGPQRNSDAGVHTETVRIAQAYVENGDLAQARAALETLDVANPVQWLILSTETQMNENPGAAETDSLVQLALALGIDSNQFLTYASQNGLLAEAASPTVASPTVEVPANTGEQPAASGGAQQAAQQPVQEAQLESPESENEGAEIDAPSVDVDGEEALAEAADTANDAGEADTGESAADEAVLEPTPNPAPTETPISNPMVVASSPMNVRGGPGTVYPIVGALGAGNQTEVIGKNPQEDWWQVLLPAGQEGWVYGELVQTSGDIAQVAVAADIPAPPPTPTPAPVAEAPPAEEEAPPPAEEEAPPPAEEPASPAEEAAPPDTSGPQYKVIEKRLWDVEENGGTLSGPSVNCGDKRELHIHVLDQNGAPMNGVAVQAIYGAKETIVTGSQGKGDGLSEFVLGEGQGVKVIRNPDGSEASSEVAEGMVTRPAGISYDDLIAGRYCSDEASCRSFVDTFGCGGHYSWTVKFQRQY